MNVVSQGSKGCCEVDKIRCLPYQISSVIPMGRGLLLRYVLTATPSSLLTNLANWLVPSASSSRTRHELVHPISWNGWDFPLLSFRCPVASCRSSIPGAGGPGIWIALILRVQAAIIAIEVAIRLHPARKIEQASIFTCYSELDEC